MLFVISEKSCIKITYKIRYLYNDNIVRIQEMCSYKHRDPHQLTPDIDMSVMSKTLCEYNNEENYQNNNSTLS